MNDVRKTCREPNVGSSPLLLGNSPFVDCALKVGRPRDGGVALLVEARDERAGKKRLTGPRDVDEAAAGFVDVERAANRSLCAAPLVRTRKTHMTIFIDSISAYVSPAPTFAPSLITCNWPTARVCAMPTTIRRRLHS